ncbi:MAG: SBBP repeat-containing protein [Promethearchaeota archaeon]
MSETKLSYYTWGGSGSESAWDIAMDSSNNSYVVGNTDSYGVGDYDLCLIKFNSSGIEWNRTYGGIHRERGESLVLDSLDNIYITGYTESFGAGGYDIWVLKINTTGGVEWNHTWGGINNEMGHSIVVDSLNNVYVAGTTNSFGEGNYDMCIIKFNSSGVVWNYTCGGIDRDSGYGVTLDPLGNAYVVGETKSFGLGDIDLFLVKFNSSGMVWDYTWGCADKDKGKEIICSPSGDLYVAGYYEQSPNCYIPADMGPIPQYIGLIKFNSEGIYQWNKTWKEENHAYASAMVMDSSGNAYIAGYAYQGYLNEYDLYLVRFNSSGVADWHCNWGGSEDDISFGVLLGPNGTAFVVGYTYSYGAGSIDLCFVEFILGQCPVKTPIDGTPPIIPGYDTIILISIAFAVSIILIKRKQ